MRFIIYTPIGAETGGPTALHQLYRTLLDLGQEAYILPTPETVGKIPAFAYRKYKPIYISKSELTKDDLLVVPEYFASIPRATLGSVGKIVYWWLSVDNSPFFYGNSNLKENKRVKIAWTEKDNKKSFQTYIELVISAVLQFRVKKFLVFTYFKVISIAQKVRGVWQDLQSTRIDLNSTFHIFQSEYARESINRKLNLSGTMVTDYIEYEEPQGSEIVQLGPESKKIVLFNGTKGADLVEALRPHISGEFQLLPLKGLNRSELNRLFMAAELYLDLGHFPGKDRIPREALKFGCPIAISSFGAGANDIDFAIPKQYKLELMPDNLEIVAQRVRDILANGKESNLEMQYTYRLELLRDRENFILEVQNLVNFCALNFSSK